MPDGFFSYIVSLLQSQYWVFFVVSIWAGTVRYLTELKGERFSFAGWMIEACVSGFVGIMTALICNYYTLPLTLTAAITGISAHNGTRSLYFITEAFKKRIK